MMELSQFISTFIENWEIVLLFFCIATLYSSVGLGGGSSYLAVLALTSLAFTQIRTTAILCNIVVVTFGSIIHAKNGNINFKKVLPLILLSVPMAFVGGYLQISQTFFFILLGFTLITASVFMWISKYISDLSDNRKTKYKFFKNVSLGGFIGFLSGMVGIGGGIFLAPLLHLTNWDTSKKIAAASSFFILGNSIGGLIGQIQNPKFSIEPVITILLLITVFIGGQIGSRLSANKISPFVLKRTTALLIAFVGVRILLAYFG